MGKELRETKRARPPTSLEAGFTQFLTHEYTLHSISIRKAERADSLFAVVSHDLPREASFPFILPSFLPSVRPSSFHLPTSASLPRRVALILRTDSGIERGLLFLFSSSPSPFSGRTD